MASCWNSSVNLIRSASCHMALANGSSRERFITFGNWKVPDHDLSDASIIIDCENEKVVVPHIALTIAARKHVICPSHQKHNASANQFCIYSFSITNIRINRKQKSFYTIDSPFAAWYESLVPLCGVTSKRREQDALAGPFSITRSPPELPSAAFSVVDSGERRCLKGANKCGICKPIDTRAAKRSEPSEDHTHVATAAFRVSATQPGTHQTNGAATTAATRIVISAFFYRTSRSTARPFGQSDAQPDSRFASVSPHNTSSRLFSGRSGKPIHTVKRSPPPGRTKHRCNDSEHRRPLSSQSVNGGRNSRDQQNHRHSRADRPNMGQSAVIEIGSSSRTAQTSSPEAHSNEIRLLDGLSTDFSYLRRFIIATNQMVRLFQTELAQNSEEIQEKQAATSTFCRQLVDNIEIAKETLSEAGASARPFVACPAHLVRYRQSYFEMLSAARSLVPYMKDADVKLRLRRLLLPLTSTSRFRVSLPAERPRVNNGTASPTWWDNSTPKAEPLGPAPAALVKTPSSRRRIRRTSSSGGIKFASSPTLYSQTSSDSPSKPPSTRSTPSASSRSHTSPYPTQSPSTPVNTDLPPSEEDAGQSKPSPMYADFTTNSPTPPPQQQPQSEKQPARPPIAYVSPQTTKRLSLLQQQHVDLLGGYKAYQKGLQSASPAPAPSSTQQWSWPGSDRSSLSGIDCNLPRSNGHPSSTSSGNNELFPSPPSCIVTRSRYSEEEFDKADENFRKGLGWAPLLNQDWSATGGVPTPSPGLTWCSSWDEPYGPRPTYASELVASVLGEPVQQKSLAESTCTSESCYVRATGTTRVLDEPAYGSWVSSPTLSGNYRRMMTERVNDINVDA
ncbi:uncharacterized protein FOMMEDRAFT_154116 [Fomitiporia mediterranea MF3/22]|uniref:uncharacterized protein n=1 Tax=Fomitiporia mediterranea (strain MF3/22) TaxID=694068 RepID=UPI0004407540|nr:uncharacterized protein FOMMEDRAFT_154116 [Fomitiporia mediterranea MF3/22]EJD04965.1 hypothetical protein FOMMEDRAFT_154116 [Fomitiporia mediterranea MF3/22]